MNKSSFKKILSKYGDYLVELETVPNITTKQIIYVQSFKDILNVKEKTNKPIYYLQGKDTVDFIFIDKNVYIYIIKDDENIKSVFEDYNAEMNDYELIKGIEQDTIIQCGDGSEYKVSLITDTKSSKENKVIQTDITLPKKRHK
ncbi:MAG: hypothetical protein IKP76_04420 [Bacilli bacterium]|nr:hypothetical protein [Bacilli bacterium]